MTTINTSRSVTSYIAQQKHTPVFLTNALCESAWGSKELFDRLGLDSYWLTGNTLQHDYAVSDRDRTERNFYPLSPVEVEFVGSDGVETIAGWAYLAYSFLYRGQKWYGAVIERNWEKSATMKADLRNIMEHDTLKLAERVEPLGGHVFFMPATEENDAGTEGTHEIWILLPMEYVQGHYSDFHDYQLGLGSLLGDLKPKEERLYLPLHADLAWRLNDQANNRWLGSIQNWAGEEVADLTALAALDFKATYEFARKLVDEQNKVK